MTMIDRTVRRGRHFRENRPGERQITPRWGHTDGHLIIVIAAPEAKKATTAPVQVTA
jgi:hypothetical protein